MSLPEAINHIRFVGGPWDGMTMPSPGDLPDRTEILMPRPSEGPAGSCLYRAEIDAGKVVLRYVGRSTTDLPPGSRPALPSA